MSADEETLPGAEQPAPGLAASLPALAGIPVLSARRAEVVFPPRERYFDAVGALRSAGCNVCVDLCGVDYLRHLDRALPAGVTPQRFEVVVNLVSHSARQRVRVRLQVPENDPIAPSLFTLYPGTENMEREAYDMLGISFSGHPDLTRILMPEDWEGHPLRKDYSPGRVPVQFKAAPGPR